MSVPNPTNDPSREPVHRLTLTDIEDRILGRLLPAQAEHNGADQHP